MQSTKNINVQPFLIYWIHFWVSNLNLCIGLRNSHNANTVMCNIWLLLWEDICFMGSLHSHKSTQTLRALTHSLSSTYIVMCAIQCGAFCLQNACVCTHTHSLTNTHAVSHMKKKHKRTHNTHNAKPKQTLYTRFAFQMQFYFSIHKHKVRGNKRYWNHLIDSERFFFIFQLRVLGAINCLKLKYLDGSLVVYWCISSI